VGGSHKDEAVYTNTNCLNDPQIALFAAYVKTLGIYKCPADREKVTMKSGQRFPRLRSYSMNSAFGREPVDWFDDPAYFFFRKTS
jgi:hypothetical protein